MRKLYQFFKVLKFQKRIVAVAIIWGYTAVFKGNTKINWLLVFELGLNKAWFVVSQIGNPKVKENHVASVHEGKKSLKCCICTTRFARKTRLNNAHLEQLIKDRILQM